MPTSCGAEFFGDDLASYRNFSISCCTTGVSKLLLSKIVKSLRGVMLTVSINSTFPVLLNSILSLNQIYGVQFTLYQNIVKANNKINVLSSTSCTLRTTLLRSFGRET